MSLVSLGLLVLLGQDRPLVLADLEAIDIQVASLNGQVEALDLRAAAVEAERATHQVALDAAEAALAARREGIAQRLRTFYRLKRRGFARLLFDAESPPELRRRVHYLWAVIRADESLARAFIDGLATRRATTARLEADKAALAGVQSDLRARLDTLGAERGRRSALVREIQKRPELAARVLRERGDAAIALTESMASVEATAPEAQGEASDFRAERGRLPSPVGGAIVRPFGAYTDPASGAPATNLGIDYGTPLGTPFRAVADGVVTRSAYLRGYGQMVMLQHGPYTTLYAHANGLRVAQGQSVKKGDVLGLVGNTGLAESEDARLHFEIRYNNTPQDPDEWLGAR
ncbi:MAG: M23 family metallopeptidase [Pseudomonadota bacterium]|nr:M23 family metallopeptidase [Pseudomonadota bacterium]